MNERQRGFSRGEREAGKEEEEEEEEEKKIVGDRGI